jgi:Domain of unknown function (DUF4136)
MNKTSIKMFLRKGLIFLLFLSASVIVLQSCYPYDDLTPEDTDVVVTFYDNGTNFTNLVTYAIPDTIYTFNSSGDIVPSEDISSSSANQILTSLNNNLQESGFTPQQGNQADADVHVFALVTSSTWVSGGCYGGYWSYWYPYYGWCYPVAYTYTTGSLFVVMLNPAKTGDSQAVWFAGVNGILSSTNASNASRINSDIDQAFNQSPYLRGSK